MAEKKRVASAIKGEDVTESNQGGHKSTSLDDGNWIVFILYSAFPVILTTQIALQYESHSPMLRSYSASVCSVFHTSFIHCQIVGVGECLDWKTGD